jgi:mRNA interferase RelE/StbE
MPAPFYKIKVPHEIAELVQGLHPHLKKIVSASLNLILTDPGKGKALKGELADLRSLRVGTFRIIYRVSKKHVEIVAVGPRQRIYEETFWSLKREGTIKD